MKLYEKLKEIKKENLISFHMPGHKNNKIFWELFKEFQSIDLTEIPGTDDLFDASECIKESQDFLTNLFHTRKSYYLVNGTTAGIYAMIMASVNKKEKIIVARDCHMSVYDAILLQELEAKFVDVEFKDNLPLGISISSLEKTIRENPDAKAVVLTYPNYYGIGVDIEYVADLVHKNNMILLVDEAHGAHLFLSDYMKSSLDVGADIVVHSTHKSLPSCTQSSVLHLNSNRMDQEKLEFMIKIMHTSSPSYLLMSSLDICYTYLEEHGKTRMKKLLDNINNIKGFEIELPKGYVKDPTKLVLDGRKYDIDPIDFEGILRKNGIQIEFSTTDYAVLVTSIMNEEKDFLELSKAMENLEFKCYSGSNNKLYYTDTSYVKISDAFYAKKKKINIKESENRISASYIIPYPPGIPLLIPGEKITEEKIDNILYLLDKKIKLLGINNLEIDVLEEE